MRVPAPLSLAFSGPFEKLLSQFAADRKLIPEAASIHSTRFLSRSVVPHVEKLSQTFNRLEENATEGGLREYWQAGSNPANLRLAYFLYFMPCNLYRVAAIWSELARLGYRWPQTQQHRHLRAIELGAGPASGACGVAAGEMHSPVGLPQSGNWALIEQDKAMLELGAEWSQEYFSNQGKKDWSIRRFHRKLDLSKPLLPASAPKFNLWVMSYFLNESLEEDLNVVADTLIKTWDRHLEEEGIVILVEPALKAQSRRLLELRHILLRSTGKSKRHPELQILLPCMGHQACGALASQDDWCHEEVSWWRPPYFKIIDQMASLDRKTLPFSYLILTRSNRPREEILPGLAMGSPEKRYRLVSPAHKEGRDLEFFLCSQHGKRRARYRPENPEQVLERGDILMDTEIRGDAHASRIQAVKKIG